MSFVAEGRPSERSPREVSHSPLNCKSSVAYKLQLHILHPCCSCDPATNRCSRENSQLPNSACHIAQPKMAPWDGLHLPVPVDDVEKLHYYLCWSMLISGAATFFTLLYGPTAPYGRCAFPSAIPLRYTVLASIPYCCLFVTYLALRCVASPRQLLEACKKERRACAVPRSMIAACCTASRLISYRALCSRLEPCLKSCAHPM